MTVSYLPTLTIETAPGQLAQTKPSVKLKMTSLFGSPLKQSEPFRLLPVAPPRLSSKSHTTFTNSAQPCCQVSSGSFPSVMSASGREQTLGLLGCSLPFGAKRQESGCSFVSVTLGRDHRSPACRSRCSICGPTIVPSRARVWRASARLPPRPGRQRRQNGVAETLALQREV